MKRTIAAIVAGALVGSAALGAVALPTAHASTTRYALSGTPSPASSLAGHVGDLHPGGVGSWPMATVHGAAQASVGALSLVDSTESDTDNSFTVSRGGTVIGTIGGFAARTTSEPQILPAGSYTVTDTAGDQGAFTVTAGGDVSEVLYPVIGGSAFGSYSDDVASAGRSSILSLRNTTSSAIDVYVNDILVAADVTADQDDVAVPAGFDTVAVVRHGSGVPSASTTVFSTTDQVPADTFIAAYVASDGTTVSLVQVPFRQGYQFTAADGGLFNYGGYPFQGSLGGTSLNRPIVGGAEDQDGNGYYLVASDGGVFAFGGAPYLGSLGGRTLNSPVVGMATTIGANGAQGYYLVAADGGVFAFGGAAFYGSLGGRVLDAPVVGIAADPVDHNYVVAESNGTTFEFTAVTPTTGVVVATGGDLNAPVVGVTETPDSSGAWLVAGDGGVFTLGDAPYLGSTGNLVLNQPVVGISPTYDGLGYTLVARDGGVFNFGDSVFYGSTGGIRLNRPVVGAVVGADPF